MNQARPTALQRKVGYWPDAILEHLDRIARTASPALGLTVPRAAVARAAVTVWLLAVAKQPPEVVLREIDAEARQSRVSLCSRYPMRLPKETARQLTQIAEFAARELGRKTGPATVIRAALRAWLADVAQRPGDVVFEEIRTAIVKRGRKRK